MILQIYTIIHTLISLAAIFTGLVVVFGMLAGDLVDVWTKWFLFAVALIVLVFFMKRSVTAKGAQVAAE
jgi:hypothetical protein